MIPALFYLTLGVVFGAVFCYLWLEPTLTELRTRLATRDYVVARQNTPGRLR